MATPMTPQATEAKGGLTPASSGKLNRLRELYADAPEIGRAALDKVMPELELAVQAQQAQTTAGRTGLRQGKVSELTMIAPFAPGGAQRLRALLDVFGGKFQGADRVGTVHDMRFVVIDDTRLLFATAYDGDWDPYIDDFASKIPDALDLLFCNLEGFPGLRSPGIKDWLAQHQVSAEAWYVGSPDLTVAETKRLERMGKALDTFLDKIAEPA